MTALRVALAGSPPLVLWAARTRTATLLDVRRAADDDVSRCPSSGPVAKEFRPDCDHSHMDDDPPARNADRRHVTVVQLQAPDGETGFRTYFEPEGGDHFLQPGDHLTITFDSDEPQEIELAMHQDGLVFWRPTRGDVRVSIVDRRTGVPITNLW
jgi:hypothetical protein